MKRKTDKWKERPFTIHRGPVPSKINRIVLKAGTILAVTLIFLSFHSISYASNTGENYDTVFSTVPAPGAEENHVLELSTSSASGFEESYKVEPSTVSYIEDEFKVSFPTDGLGIPIRIKSDYARYIREEDKLFVKGNVEVEYEGTVIKCDELDIKIKEKEIEARGNCSIEDDYLEVLGSSITYNYETKDGIVLNANCRVDKWYLKGPKMVKKGKKKFILYDGYCSSCDLFPPHYKFAAKKIIIVPKKRIVFHWVGLKALYKIPVIVSPWFIIPLDKKGLKGRPGNYEFGEDGKDGYYVKVWHPYRLIKELDGLAEVKYSQKNQWAFGMDNKYEAEGLKGDLIVQHNKFHYTVENTTIPATRSNWLIHGKHNQDFAGVGIPGLLLQANINYMNNSDFNKNYNRDEGVALRRKDMELVTSEISSDMALTYSRPNYSLGMVLDRKDKWDADTERYYPTLRKAPNLYFNLNRRKILGIFKLPVYADASYRSGTTYTNNYELSTDTSSTTYGLRAKNDYYLKNADVNAALSTSFSINKINTLNFNFNYYNNRKDRMSKDDLTKYYKEGISGGFGWTSDLMMVCLLPVKMNYAFKWDFVSNKATGNSINFRIDSTRGRGSEKGKVKAVLITGLNLMGYEESLSLQNMYDYFLENLNTMNVQMNYETKKSRYNATYVNNINNSIINPISVNGTYTPLGSDEMIRSLKVVYRVSDPSDPLDLEELDITGKIKLLYKKMWKFDVNLRAKVHFKDILSSNVTESTFNIYKDLHCWEMNITWSRRPTWQEVWVKFNIKVIPTLKIGVQNNRTLSFDSEGHPEWNSKTRITTQ